MEKQGVGQVRLEVLWQSFGVGGKFCTVLGGSQCCWCLIVMSTWFGGIALQGGSCINKTEMDLGHSIQTQIFNAPKLGPVGV